MQTCQVRPVLPASEDNGCDLKKKLKIFEFLKYFPFLSYFFPLKWHVPVQQFLSHCVSSIVNCWVFVQVDASFPYSDFLLHIHYHYYDCFLILPSLWHFQGQEGFSLPLYTFLTVRDFEGQHSKQGGKEKDVLVGWDENMNGLVSKWEQKEGETGTRSTMWQGQ